MPPANGIAAAPRQTIAQGAPPRVEALVCAIYDYWARFGFEIEIWTEAIPGPDFYHLTLYSIRSSLRTSAMAYRPANLTGECNVRGGAGKWPANAAPEPARKRGTRVWTP